MPSAAASAREVLTRLHEVMAARSGAQAKLIFLAVASQDKTDRLVELLSPLLDSHGLILFIGTVEVISDTAWTISGRAVRVEAATA